MIINIFILNHSIHILVQNYPMNTQDKILAFLGLIIVCGFGYSIDMPQALQAPLRQQPYNLTSIEINLLYFCSFIPVMITDIPIGIILDKYPLQIAVLVIAISSFISELIIAILFDFRPDGYLIGVYLMRAIGGMAGSSAYTMQGFLIARYASQNYEILIGVGMTIPLILDSINVSITPYIFDSTKSISLPWYIASMVDFLAVISAICIAVIVTRKEKRIKDQSLLRSEQGEEQQQQQEEQFKFNYILTLPKMFWIILSTVFFFQMSTLIFQNLNDLLINRFAIPYTTVANLVLIPNTLGALLALLFGKLVSTKIKKIRRSIILLAPILLITGTTTLYFLPNNDNEANITASYYLVIIFFLVMLSCMVASVFSVVSTSLSLLVDKRRLGTVWGVCGMAIGLSESIVPMLNGLVQKENDLPNSYRNLNLVFIIISTIGLIFGVIIYFGPFQKIDTTFFEQNAKDNSISLASEGTITENKEG